MNYGPRLNLLDTLREAARDDRWTRKKWILGRVVNNFRFSETTLFIVIETNNDCLILICDILSLLFATTSCHLSSGSLLMLLAFFFFAVYSTHHESEIFLRNHRSQPNSSFEKKKTKMFLNHLTLRTRAL